MLMVMMLLVLWKTGFTLFFLTSRSPSPHISIHHRDTWFPIHWLTYIDSEVFLPAKFPTALYILCWSVFDSAMNGWKGRRIHYTNGGQCRGYVYRGRVLERGAVIFIVTALSSLYCVNDSSQGSSKHNSRLALHLKRLCVLNIKAILGDWFRERGRAFRGIY